MNATDHVLVVRSTSDPRVDLWTITVDDARPYRAALEEATGFEAGAAEYEAHAACKSGSMQEDGLEQPDDGDAEHELSDDLCVWFTVRAYTIDDNLFCCDVHGGRP